MTLLPVLVVICCFVAVGGLADRALSSHHSRNHVHAGHKSAALDAARVAAVDLNISVCTSVPELCVITQKFRNRTRQRLKYRDNAKALAKYEPQPDKTVWVWSLLPWAKHVKEFEGRQIDCPVACGIAKAVESADVVFGNLGIGDIPFNDSRLITAIQSFESCRGSGCQNKGEDILISYSDIADVTELYNNMSDVDWLARPKPKRPDNGKPSSLIFISLKCNTWRTKYLQKLSKLGVDIKFGGRCLHNYNVPNCTRKQYNTDCTAEAISQFPFAITFENNVIDGYVTEKWQHMWASGSIPVYLGSPTIKEKFKASSCAC